MYIFKFHGLYSCKNWKAGFSASSTAGFTSLNSFTCSELERSSTEKEQGRVFGFDLTYYLKCSCSCSNVYGRRG
ncbi:hypothetical protein Hanom_Chr01g00010661 [Helianthus anomalus]